MKKIQLSFKITEQDNIGYIIHTQNSNIMQNVFEASFFKTILKLLGCVYISNWF